MSQSKRILFCTAEVAPFAKVGGLADVAGSLPQALTARGHEVIVAAPAYEMILQHYAPQRTFSFLVRVNPWWTAEVLVQEVVAEGLRLWLIDGPGFFAGVTRSELIYSPTRDAYLFFAQAALQACEEDNWIPDVVHAHDWHMGFIPVLIKETRGKAWDNVASCFTIHNLAYQGEFGFDTLDAAGLPHRLFNLHALETYGNVNFLKAGCAFADRVNTVSPTYSQEIQTPEFGCRLEGLMQHLAENGRLRGILNGIDVRRHNPANDPDLPAHFSADDPSGKADCRVALHKELGLDPDPSAPILGMVSRLSSQKGFDLIISIANRIVGMGVRLVVQGLGDPWAAGELRRLQDAYPERVRFIEAFDAPMAQRVYGGSDIFLMPSAFEPCGLGQMFAMRYGTVPVVRKTGGLADTVTEGETGFVFDNKDAEALYEAISRAVRTYRSPDHWQTIVQNCLTQDWSWTKSAVAYEEMYDDALKARRTPVKAATGSAS